MGFHESNGLRYYQFDIFKGHPLFHAVITRQADLVRDLMPA